MHRYVVKFVIILSLLMVRVFGNADEVIMKLVQTRDGGSEYSFIQQSVVIARQIVDSSGASHVEGLIPDGLVREYYPSGRIKLEKTFSGNREDGPYRAFYSNGKPEYDGVFKNGHYDGVCREYYESGQVASVMMYHEGQLDGSWIDYFPSGAVKAERHFKQGKWHGVSTIFDEDGNTIESMNYAAGELLFGTRKEYYPGGVLKYRDSYRNGIKINRQAFDENGTLIFTKNY